MKHKPRVNVLVKVLLLGIVGILGIASFVIFSAITDNMYYERLSNFQTLSQISAQVNTTSTKLEEARADQAEMRFSVTSTPSGANTEKITQTLEQATVELNEAKEKLTKIGIASQKLQEEFNNSLAALEAFQQASASHTDTAALDKAALVAISKLETLQQSVTSLRDATLKPLHGAVNRNIVMHTVQIALVFLVVFLIMRQIRSNLVTSVEKLQTSVLALRDGDLTTRFTSKSNDEVADMLQALSHSQDELIDVLGSGQALADTAATRSNYVVSAAHAAAQSAEEMVTQAQETTKALSNMSTQLQTVASGAEEMNASIREISASSRDASRTAMEADGVAQNTQETISQLNQTTQDIEKVINMVSTIASQTNLLALNATIEAARAGDAGKDFAVVAGEVKDLAAETAQATNDISQMIAQIQQKIDKAVAAIEGIVKIVAEINNYQGTISEAVEEQSTVTQGIAQSIAKAANDSKVVSTSLDNYCDSVTTAQTDINRLSHSADSLSQQVQGLTAELQKLKTR